MIKLTIGEREQRVRLHLDPDPRWGTEHDPRFTLCDCEIPNVVICACCKPGKRECLDCGLPVDDLGFGL